MAIWPLDHWRKTGEKLLTHTCYTYSSEKHQRRHNYHLVISVQYIVLCYTIVHASMYDFEEDFKSVLLQSLKFKPLICASLLTFNWWLVNQQTNEPTLQRPAAQIFCLGNILSFGIHFREYLIIWNINIMNFIEVGCNTFVTFCTVINAKPDSAQLCKGNQHFVHSAMHTVQCTHNSSKAQRGGGSATRSSEMPLFMTFCVDVEYHRFVAVVQSTTNRLNKLDANLAHWPSAVSDCS